MNAYDHDTLGKLIAALPPAPDGWVRAAQELPAARRGISEIIARAEADAAYRARFETFFFGHNARRPV